MNESLHWVRTLLYSSPTASQTWYSSQTWPRIPWMKGWPGPLEEGPWSISKRATVNLSPILSQRDLWHITRTTVHWGKDNDQTFWGLLDIDSQLALILGNPKCPCDFSVKVGAYGVQWINKVLATLQFPVGPVDTWTYCVVYYPVLECTIGLDLLSPW